MKTNSQPIWPSLITTVTFIMVLMLSACGGSPGGSPVVTSSPTALLEGATQGAGSSPIGSPVVIGYDDGSVYRFSGNTATPSVDFEFLAYSAGPNSSVKLMANYEYNGQQYLMVAEGNNDLYLWNGTVWQTYKITTAQSTAAAVTQMVSYKGGVVVGLADGEVWQLLNNSWTRLHDWGFDSPVAGITVNGNSLAIVLGDGAIFQLIAVDTTTCANNQPPCWTDLRSPTNGLAVSQLISYTDNSNHSMLAIALSNGVVYTNDGTTTWTNIGGDGGAKVTQMSAYSNSNWPTQNSFLVAFSDGKVFQWVPGTGFVLVLTVPSSTPVTELIAYNNLLIASYQNSLVQVHYIDSRKSYVSNLIAGAGWDSEVKQMAVVNNQLIVRLQDGKLKEWDGNTNYNWNDLNVSEYSSQQLTLMGIYNANLVLGFGDGSILQWKGSGNQVYAELHDSSWGSAVVKLVNWNNNPAVALANGAVEALQNSTNWTEYEGASPNIPCHGDGSYPSQQIQLVTTQKGDGLIVGLSRGDDNKTATNSSSVIKDLTNQTEVPGSEICVDGSNNEDNAFQDKITQMITYHDSVYAGYADGGTVRGWDGISTDSLFQIHDAGWTSPVSSMGIVNDYLVIGLANGAIEQWNGAGVSSEYSWTELHDSSLGSEVSQILEYNGTLVARFANSLIMQNTGGNSETTISIQWSHPLTQIAVVKGVLTAGLADGTLLQFDNLVNLWNALPAVGTNSAVNQIVDNGNLIVGFANGSFAQWDGSNWAVFTPNAGHAITQMMVQ